MFLLNKIKQYFYPPKLSRSNTIKDLLPFPFIDEILKYEYRIDLQKINLLFSQENHLKRMTMLPNGKKLIFYDQYFYNQHLEIDGSNMQYLCRKNITHILAIFR